MSGYELTRLWFDFCFEKKEAKVQHTALFMWIIELNNRLNWKSEFGLPTLDTMEVLSIGNRNTYFSALKDLQEWGFISIIQESKNQYQSCVISVKVPVQKCTSIDTSIDTSSDTSIDTSSVHIDKQYKPINLKTFKPLNNKNIKKSKFDFSKGLREVGADELLIRDWMQVRKEKKASNTETALTTFLNQAKESGFPINEVLKLCIEKSWKGFRAEWIKNLNNQNVINYGNSKNEWNGKGQRPESEDEERYILERLANFSIE